MQRRTLLLALVFLAISLGGGIGESSGNWERINNGYLDDDSNAFDKIIESAESYSFLQSEDDEGEVVIVSVDNTNLRFSPESITLNEGDTVRFLWSGELLAHNAVEENGLFDSGDPSRNVNYSYTFAIGENGTYEYVCEPHESLGMIGTIVVDPIQIVEPEPEPEPLPEDNDSSTMSIGDGKISIVIFSPWFLGVILFVGYISFHRDRFHLGVVLEEGPESIENESQELPNIELEYTGNEKWRILGMPIIGRDTLVESYRARVLTLCALYVAQGIPWGFITIAFLTFLADKGVGAAELALMLTLGTLPWSFKFLWGPVIDRFQVPSMGRRRPWILLAQSGMIVALASMMLIPNPEDNVTVMAWMFLIYNIFTSLQDVSTDALAIDILKPHEIEKVNSYMFTSKTIGGIIGGAGLGVVIGTLGIKGTILLQIPILVMIMLVPMYMTERPGEKRFPWSEGGDSVFTKDDNRDFKEIISKVMTAFSLRSTRLGVVLSLVMSLYAFLVPVLPLLFVRELDWTIEEFNATKGGVIMVFVVLSYLVGGQLGRKFGGKSIIIYSALLTSITTALWGVSESMWGNGLFMMTMWSITTFTWGLATINIYSLVMKITWSEVGGTQFTAYMAMMNLSAIIGYQLTDPITSRFDYPTIFLLAAAFQTIVIFGALFIDPDETRNSLSNPS